MYNLTSQNFHVMQGTPSTLALALGNKVFVFFKSPKCNGCESLAPIFSKLARVDNRLTFASIDVTKNNEVIKLSQNTSTPITTVPCLILYNDGIPYARFRGQRNESSLISFLNTTLSQLDVPQSFVPVQPQQQNMYGGQRAAPNQRAFMPDTQSFPSQAKNIANNPIASSSHPSMQQCDPEDPDCLMVPKNVIPYNMPWESDFQKYGLGKA